MAGKRIEKDAGTTDNNRISSGKRSGSVRYPNLQIAIQNAAHRKPQEDVMTPYQTSCIPALYGRDFMYCSIYK